MISSHMQLPPPLPLTSVPPHPRKKHKAMTKIDSLRRILLPCFTPSTTATSSNAASTVPTKRRLSTSLVDDPQHQEPPQEPSSPSLSPASAAVPQRPSKTMVIGTIFGPKNPAKGHVWFCVQHDRLSLKPILLLEFSLPTVRLAREMETSGLVRVALEARMTSPDPFSCPLRSVPEWTVHINGKTVGFAVRRKACERTRLMLQRLESMTVGAGIFPASSGDADEVMYMRANYEHVVGSSDSESFHLINPDESHGQELSIFLLRSMR